MIGSLRTAALVLTGLLSVGAPAPPVAHADEPVDVTGQERIVDGLIPVTGAEREPARLDLRIGFRLGSAELTEAGRRQLDQLAAALASDRLADIRVGLHGHTDASGPADYNMSLSVRRADAARRYLVEEHGIDPARLDAAGFGERRLRPDLPPEAAGQRRVEVVNLTPERVRPARRDDTAEDEPEPEPAAEDGAAGATAITE